MLEFHIDIPKRLLKASDFEKSLVIDGLLEVFGLNKANRVHRLKPGGGVNKIIAELESRYYKLLWNRKEINEKILKYIKSNNLLKKQISDNDYEKFRKYLAGLFNLPLKNINELVVRSFIIGATIELGEKPVALNIGALPGRVKDAIKSGKLTWDQVRYIGAIQRLAAEHITGVSEATQHRIRQMLIEANSDNVNPKRFAQLLFEEFGEEGMLNRDMERIAISEMNKCANAGFISGLSVGEYVIGVSHTDACDWCLNNINNKIMKVIDNPPPDYASLPPESKQYQDIAKIWDTCIWETKTNMGRSTAKRAKTDNGYRKREHHELASPGVLCHVSGRCRWVKFMPEYMYIKNDEMKYVSNEQEDAERKVWLEKHPEIKSTM